MGQYFKPCVLSKNYKTNKKTPVIASLTSWDYSNGAKLMEHSWVGNRFVKAAIKLIAMYKAHPFVWCGDYADERFINQDNKECNAYEIANSFDVERFDEMTKEHNVEEEYKYIINYTKRQYVEIPDYDENVWTIHPLPLLCADGNERGGGDYHGINMDVVGSWAYDRIGVTNKRPHYKKINVEFSEK